VAEPKPSRIEPMKRQNPDIRDGFKFLAGHVALDLPGTLAARLKPSPRELLSQPDDLGRWLIAAQLSTAAPEVTQADLMLARTLRESIYTLALARIDGGALPDDARRKLNRIAADDGAVPKLDARSRVHLSGSARAYLASIAGDAIRLFGSQMSDRIRQCEGKTCALLFLDTSRAGDRRWCSMSGCGNRAKVADFRRRQRAL
jgi:predicted RNA-binding Zn ribbon-like protein